MRFAIVRGEEVVSYGQCQPEAFGLHSLAPGEIVLEPPMQPRSHWWDGAVFQEKTAMGVSIDFDDMIVSGAPTGTRYEVFGALYAGGEFTDPTGVMEFTFVLPGTYRVLLHHPRHIVEEISFVVD